MRETSGRDCRDSVWDFPICRFAVHGDEFHQNGAVRVVRWSPKTQWPEAREVPFGDSVVCEWVKRVTQVPQASDAALRD